MKNVQRKLFWPLLLTASYAFVLDKAACRISTRQLSLPTNTNHDFIYNNNTVPSRRTALKILGWSALSAPLAATAGIAELDPKTGVLYSPKAEMLSGGSVAARGITSKERPQRRRNPQTIYETRFIAYLSRFLLNFDPSARAWWQQQGLGDSWETFNSNNPNSRENFAEFAESVEIGLTDYFTGPYGSYSSPTAARAGLLAQPAPSVPPSGNTIEGARQGILNLYALLQARYTSVSAKRQLAILFSFVSSPKLQPTSEIRALLAECDNACVSQVQLITPSVNEFYSRTSSQRGGGYSVSEPPRIKIASPPALGSDYVPAEVKPRMKPTSRLLRIDLVDGGEGYTGIPQVRIRGSALRSCQAAAILDRNGSLESILVLDPGYGYAGGRPPRVDVDPPPSGRRARAVASLEYEIVGLSIVRGGNGYISTEPPTITISPPENDPDWFLAPLDPKLRPTDIPSIHAKVTEMNFPDGSLAYTAERNVGDQAVVDDALLERMKNNPLEMLPSNIRPQDYKAGTYAIPFLVDVPQVVPVLSPRYRAFDPVFGGVGKVPVTKGAVALSASEYGRLALSGAVCTVVVRTALNPLELIKTKQQLLNDNELFDFAARKSSPKEAHNHQIDSLGDSDTDPISDAKLGTVDIAKSMAELRGPWSLFQSADITFLASLVFGSFGFGATELFRRSFTAFFIADSGVDEGGLDVVAVLAAASLATVVTAAAATPFEVLRVRSMGLVQPEPWTNVLKDFIGQKSGQKMDDFSLTKVKPQEVIPLWEGFAPTVSRELPFAVVKFLTFDLCARTAVEFLNARASEGSLPIQVGAGPLGLSVSALSGAIAGVFGAFVSHPADLILTKTSSKSSSKDEEDWRDIVRDLLSKEGGPANLFVGLPARSTFFFLVIGLQFFLYDYVKNLLNVGQDDLNLVLDVFYAVRAGLSGGSS